jgi:hypothetical protein
MATCNHYYTSLSILPFLISGRGSCDALYVLFVGMTRLRQSRRVVPFMQLQHGFGTRILAGPITHITPVPGALL